MGEASSEPHVIGTHAAFQSLPRPAGKNVVYPVPNPPRSVVVDCGVGGPEPSSNPYQCRCKSCRPPPPPQQPPPPPRLVSTTPLSVGVVSAFFWNHLLLCPLSMPPPCQNNTCWCFHQILGVSVKFWYFSVVLALGGWGFNWRRCVLCWDGFGVDWARRVCSA